MKIRIIQVGKTKEDWLKQAMEHYLVRMRPFCQVEFVTLGDVSLKLVNNTDEVKHKEADIIKKAIKSDEYIILLAENGKQYNSFEFATELDKLSDRKIAFVIGGVYGTAPELEQQVDHVMSLSRLTFTHQMVRLVLIEQIYRAMMINRNRTYHY